MALPTPPKKRSVLRALVARPGFWDVLFELLLPAFILLVHQISPFSIETQQGLAAGTLIALECSPFVFFFAVAVCTNRNSERREFLDKVRPKHSATLDGIVSPRLKPDYDV